MPIYEYRCKDCQQIFEEWCKHVEHKTGRACPICKGEAERLISNTSFALKGGGWYVTEYGTHRGKDKEEKACRAGAETTTAESSPKASEKPAAPTVSS